MGNCLLSASKPLGFLNERRIDCGNKGLSGFRFAVRVRHLHTPVQSNRATRIRVLHLYFVATVSWGYLAVPRFLHERHCMTAFGKAPAILRLDLWGYSYQAFLQ